ncbi:MAG: OsmC family protein [Kofleriaceae bacterium]
MSQHTARLSWSGSTADTYLPHARGHGDGKPEVALSPTSAYGGDDARWNPEELLAMSLGYCHLLTFLSLARKFGLDVRGYDDAAVATLATVDKVTQVTKIRLAPTIRVAGGDEAKVREAFAKAHKYCFIGNSVRCEVELAPTVELIAP